MLPVALAMLAACAKQPESTPKAQPDDAWALDAAREYSSYTKLADFSRLSPLDCWLPEPEGRISASHDVATHGRKLYYLFARDGGAYYEGRRQGQPEGQVIVKEAWDPVPVAKASDPAKLQTADGRRFTTGAKAGLFLMAKRNGAWTYATVNADATRVLESGQISACVKCHRAAPHDSLFGDDMYAVDPKHPRR